VKINGHAASVNQPLRNEHGSKERRADVGRFRVITLDDLAEQSRWVAWREEERARADGKLQPTKIPYDPHSQHQARIPTAPETWGRRAEAKQRWRKLDDGRRGGVGIVLGDLGDGTHLLGIDLDGCIGSNGSKRIDDLAREIIDRIDSYAEHSPSGKGIKLFFRLRSRDMPALEELLGHDESGKAKTRKTFAAGKHHEIAVDTARYYTVTANGFDDVQDLHIVPIKDLRWLLAEVGPRFLARHRKPGDERSNGNSQDQSGSGFGFRFLASCKAPGMDFEAACEAIINDSGEAGEWARRAGNRQLRRAWKRSPERAFDDVDVGSRKRQAPAPVTAQALEGMTFPPLKYVVPDVIVEGVTIFAGKPKIGKSWLMLHAAYAVATGGATLGGIACKQGDVLYCALEDYSLRRVHKRLHMLQIPQPWPERLAICCQMPRFNEGGVEFIRAWVKSVKRPRLVIIDTLKKVRKVNQGKNETQYDSDYEAVAELAELANKCGIAIVLVHHERKLDADDPFDTVSGTLGLTAAADTILILRRDKSGVPLLMARGRDIPEMEKAMRFGESCRWKILGDGAEFRQSRARMAISKAMNDIGEAATPHAIAAVAELNSNAVSKLVTRMAGDGLVFRHGYGKWSLQRSARGHHVRSQWGEG
jgi:hypothetical protein